MRLYPKMRKRCYFRAASLPTNDGVLRRAPYLIGEIYRNNSNAWQCFIDFLATLCYGAVAEWGFVKLFPCWPGIVPGWALEFKPHLVDFIVWPGMVPGWGLKPVLNWTNVCSPEHTSDTSTNYDSFLNWTFSSPNMVRTVQTLLISQLACNEMQASARTCGRRAADSMIENVG